jgi:hypothetical protein
MFEEFRRIISSLDKECTIYLSNFTPVILFHEIINLGYKVKLLPSDLQASIDVRALKACDPEEKAHIIWWPFLGVLRCDKELADKQLSHHFTLHTIKGNLTNHIHIDAIYREVLSKSPDLDLCNTPCSDAFALFLRPHMFCPKDDIIEELKKLNIPHESSVYSLYKLPYFDSVKKDQTIARECLLSFLSLPLDVTEDQARSYAQILLDVLASHSLRRCSF